MAGEVGVIGGGEEGVAERRVAGCGEVGAASGEVGVEI